MRQTGGLGTTTTTTSLTSSSTTTTSGSRFRQRKLNVKAHLPVLREADFVGIDGAHNNAHDGQDGDRAHDSALTSLPKVESGVESKEEKVRLFWFFAFLAVAL